MNALEFTHWLQDYSLQRDVRPLVMGIVNTSRDSFYQNSRYPSDTSAFEKAMEFVSKGVDIIDIGGQSTRPGAAEISVEEELERVISVIEKIRKHSDICLSLDTYKPKIMDAGINLGVNLINDVKALQMPGALELVAKANIPVCLMHMYGNPQNMMSMVQEERNLIPELRDFFKSMVAQAKRAGISEHHIILDPGIGFGKSMNQNIFLIKNLKEFYDFGYPILVGLSRKSCIGELTGKSVTDRKAGSLAGNVMAYINGARILRTHDPDETKDALRVSRAIVKA
jgi:dihydropteroate synthase